MKKVFLIQFCAIICIISLSAQMRVNEYGFVTVGYNILSGGGAGPSLFIGEQIGTSAVIKGEWGIEIFNGGLNFVRPWPNPNSGNYKLFIQDGGNVGIGRIPSYKLDVNGDIATYGTLVISSDERLKSNIRSLGEEKNKLYLLEGKFYQKTVLENATDSIDAAKGFPISEKMNPDPKPEYGYLAQELKEIFPDLVTEDSEGYYSINYIGLIPIITEVLKEHNRTITDLQSTIQKQQTDIALLEAEIKQNGSLRSSGETTEIINPVVTQCTLYQNAPNPFSQSTQIKYYLPATVKTAYLCIYDLQGAQLKQTVIQERGEGVQILYGSELKAGMYLYTLIADGKEVDTKRMILTK